jgi:hypothetical protein
MTHYVQVEVKETTNKWKPMSASPRRKLNRHPQPDKAKTLGFRQKTPSAFQITTFEICTQLIPQIPVLRNPMTLRQSSG